MTQETFTTSAGQITILRKWRQINANQRRTIAEALCVCGKTFQVRYDFLKGKTTHSCGCYGSKQISKIQYKHGHTRFDRKLRKIKPTPTYISWAYMKKRCLNKNGPLYCRNDRMGIKICDEWLEFTGFLKDMGEKPIGHRFARKDKSGDYEPDNCEWIPLKHK